MHESVQSFLNPHLYKTGSEDEQDADEGGAVVHARPAALGFGRFVGQESGSTTAQSSSVTSGFGIIPSYPT